MKNDLFDNPMVRAANASMTPEQKEEYKLIGERLFAGIDYESANPDLESIVSEAVAYIKNQLQSGMHPSMLELNEKQTMENVYGQEWYKKWGYIEQDLTQIVTLEPTVEVNTDLSTDNKE